MTGVLLITVRWIKMTMDQPVKRDKKDSVHTSLGWINMIQWIYLLIWINMTVDKSVK